MINICIKVEAYLILFFFKSKSQVKLYNATGDAPQLYIKKRNYLIDA